MLAEVAADIRTVFNAPDWVTAEVYLAKLVQKYTTTASRLADWLEKNIPEGLAVFDFPIAHQRKIRTINGLERVNSIQQAELDEGERQDGLRSSEREELTKLRRENKRLRQEREILAKAAAWFAQETDAVPPKSSRS